MKLQYTFAPMIFVAAVTFAAVIMQILNINSKLETQTTHPCIRKEKIWIPDEHRMMQVWYISGHPYAVRGNEILGRWSRFYNEEFLRTLPEQEQRN